jgi:hypothetical protein
MRRLELGCCNSIDIQLRLRIDAPYMLIAFSTLMKSLSTLAPLWRVDQDR